MANGNSEIEILIALGLFTVLSYIVYKSIKTWGPFNWEKKMAPSHYKVRLYGTLLFFWVCAVLFIMKLFGLINDYFFS